MIKNILACLDGTELSESILPLVAEIAKRFGSKIVLLKVIVIPLHLSGVGKAEIVVKQSTWDSEHEKEVENYFERIAEPLRKQGLDVDCVTIEGTVEESIIAYARTYKVSLIALATHGRNSLSRFIFGSTTETVLRKSSIPVLAVCPDNTQ